MSAPPAFSRTLRISIVPPAVAQRMFCFSSSLPSVRKYVARHLTVSGELSLRPRRPSPVHLPASAAKGEASAAQAWGAEIPRNEMSDTKIHSAVNNFGNLKSVRVIMMSNANLSPALLGEIENNPNQYATMLNLPINSTVNFKNYLPQSGPLTLNYQVAGKVRTRIKANLTIKVVALFNVNLTFSGL